MKLVKSNREGRFFLVDVLVLAGLGGRGPLELAPSTSNKRLALLGTPLAMADDDVCCEMESGTLDLSYHDLRVELERGRDMGDASDTASCIAFPSPGTPILVCLVAECWRWAGTVSDSTSHLEGPSSWRLLAVLSCSDTDTLMPEADTASHDAGDSMLISALPRILWTLDMGGEMIGGMLLFGLLSGTGKVNLEVRPMVTMMFGW